jgi:hypothetical protein
MPGIEPWPSRQWPIFVKTELFRLLIRDFNHILIRGNLTLHNDIKIPFVKNEILRIAESYKAQTANHDNKLIEELYTNGPVTRRLNRTWPQDIIYQ